MVSYTKLREATRDPTTGVDIVMAAPPEKVNASKAKPLDTARCESPIT
jgi:hypothetical protein